MPQPARLPATLRWGILALLSLLITTGFEVLHLPAALLLGPMVAAILLALRGIDLKLPQPVMTAAQASACACPERCFCCRSASECY